MHYALQCLVWGWSLRLGMGYWLFGENKGLLQWLLTPKSHQTDVLTRHIARAGRHFRDCWLTGHHAWVVSDLVLLGCDVPAGGIRAASTGSVLAGHRTPQWKLPAGTAETGTRHFPGMLLCKCSFDINHWICFAIFVIQLSFGEWWLFQAFRCWGWTKVWHFNDSHVAFWHLWIQCLLYFAYSIASAVFSQNLVGMPHAGWIIFIYVMYLLRYPSSSKISWQTFSSFASGVLAVWADSDAFQYTYFLIPLTCRT